MTRYSALALIALAACASPREQASDSTTPLTVDTLKAVVAGDTLPTKIATDSPATKTVVTTPPAKTTGAQTKTSTKSGTKKLGRDSAIQPPNLPQLDTVKRKKPPI